MAEGKKQEWDSSQTYNILNKAWKSTCKVLLGEEIGDISEYNDYVSKYLEPIITRKSAVSGKDVAVFSHNFCKDAKFISHDEADEYNKKLRTMKLDINEIKDIDSILQALSDKICYCGNVTTGNSREVEGSDGITNSMFVYKSSEVYDSKYVAFSDSVRSGEYIFGTNWSGESKFLIKGYETGMLVRSMEIIRTAFGSDCYYTASVDESTNCMFSFNQIARHNLIGNVEFPKDEYKKLKDKLIEDIRTTLKSKKTIPTIVDILRDGDGY
jgi:DNA-directed RNA polymerase subunit H (RpoH/RPB5)